MIICNGLCFVLTTQIRDFEGPSREVNKYISKMEDRARQEEELFNRVPLTREERKREKHMKKATNGYGEGLIISFYKSIKCMMTFFLLVFCFYLHPCLLFCRMQGLTESLFDEIRVLPFEDDTREKTMGSRNGGKRNGKLKKRKVCPFDTLKLLCENINNTTFFEHWKCTFISVQHQWMWFVLSCICTAKNELNYLMTTLQKLIFLWCPWHVQRNYLT